MVKHAFAPAFTITPLHHEGVCREINAEVVFGTPSKHCAGAGICMVSISSNLLRLVTCPTAPVWISSAGAAWLQFRFEKSVLGTAIKNRLNMQEFVVEEAFRLPLQLVRQLGLNSCWGAPGIYPVMEQKNDWIIRFNLL